MDSKTLQAIIDTPQSYDDFRKLLEATPHAIVHAAIGGQGGDLTTMQSPNDPLFFLHHR